MPQEKITKYVDNIIFGALLLYIFVLPYENHSNGFYSLAFFTALGGWILKMLVNRKVFFTKTPIDIFIIIYFIACLLSTIFSINPEFSIKTMRKEIIMYVIMFYVFVNNMQDDKKISWGLKVFMLSGLFVCIYGCYAYFRNCSSPDFRLESTFRQPNRYAQYLIILSALSVAFIAISKSIKEKLIYIAFFILVLANLFWTYSRAGWVAFFIAMMIFMVKSSRLIKIGIIAILVIFITGIFLNNKALARFKFDNGERKLIYSSVFNVISDYPIIGVGYGDKNFLDLYKNQYKSPNALEDHSGTHNIFLQATVETGVIGLLAFIILHAAILTTMINAYIKSKELSIKWIILWCIVSFAGVFLIGQLHTLYRDRNVHIFWMIVSVAIICWKKKDCISATNEK